MFHVWVAHVACQTLVVISFVLLLLQSQNFAIFEPKLLSEVSFPDNNYRFSDPALSECGVESSYTLNLVHGRTRIKHASTDFLIIKVPFHLLKKETFSLGWEPGGINWPHNRQFIFFDRAQNTFRRERPSKRLRSISLVRSSRIWRPSTFHKRQ